MLINKTLFKVLPTELTLPFLTDGIERNYVHSFIN